MVFSQYRSCAKRVRRAEGQGCSGGTCTTLNALAVEAFNDLLKKHGKKASVENPLLD